MIMGDNWKRILSYLENDYDLNQTQTVEPGGKALCFEFLLISGQ